MQVEVITPEKKLYSGEAESINLPGASGSFEILNNHAPIIAALQRGQLTIVSNEGKIQIEVEDGFVECVKNVVNVLVSNGKIIS